MSIDTSAGVHTRELLDENATCPDETGTCTWTYDFDTPSVSERKVVVTSPLGDDTVHYFATPPDRVVAGWIGWEYGLPFWPTVADPTLGGRYLSRIAYDGPVSAGQAKRTTYVAYEHDQIPSGVPEAPGDEWFNTNRRLVSERTVFHDDADSSITRTFSNFDGLGNYRIETVTASGITGAPRTVTTTFNPSAGTSNPGTIEYKINPSTNSVITTFNMLPATAPWVIGSWDRRTVTEGDSQIVSEACFERDAAGYASTGFVTRTRAWKNTTPPATRSGQDLLAVFTRDGDGNVTTEEYRGGDGAALGEEEPLCDETALGAIGYEIQHTYLAGVRESSRHFTPGTSSAFPYDLDLTIDKSTGLASASRDSAGFERTFAYDSSGRLIRAFAEGGNPDEQDGAERRYTYVEAAGATPAMVQILACEPNGAPCFDPLDESWLHFDGLGRVERERRMMAVDGTWSKRVFVTDAMGHRVKASELESDGVADGSLHYTLQQSFDPFDRPTIIIPPDGVAHQVTLSYEGVQRVDRTVKVATVIDAAETAATTIERYDLHGRLRQVEEPAGLGGAAVTATYAYDAAGRLKTVSHTAGAVTQDRAMVYDGRGFLLEERYPEKLEDTHRVCYLGYDARGHAGRKIDVTELACSPAPSAEGHRDLLFTYDKAERLTEVREGGMGGRVLKAFAYDDTGVAGWSKGKLLTATRHNYPGGVHAPVVEAYAYLGVEGRVSSRSTTLDIPGGQFESAPTLPFPEGAGYPVTYAQTFGYDRLGQVQTLGYPECGAGGWCNPDPGASPRTVTNTYSRGFLTRVASGDFPDNELTYHPNGTLSEVQHANEVIDTIGLDPAAMRRPASIATGGVFGTGNWSSGSFAYDGAGNVKAIGFDRFRYDLVSRLVEARMHQIPGVGGAQYTQIYTFDGFGNLNEIAGHDGVTLSTSPTTNRLTTPMTTYDDAGNVLAWNGHTYTYDRLGMMTERTTPLPNSYHWLFAYTADDERIWAYRLGTGEQQQVLRDLAGRPLREYSYTPPLPFADGFESGNTAAWGASPRRIKDYVYRGDQLLLSQETVAGRRHYHLDHLGSPRLITNTQDPPRRVSQHTYLPFGGELLPPSGDKERLKFTGHERDKSDPAGVGDDLDYMHARFCSPITGRFLSADSSRWSRAALPQSWNKYAYTINNPLKLVDRNGQWPTHIKHVHQASIDRVLSFLPSSDRAILKEQQVIADKNQSTAGSFRHAMRGAGESATAAMARANRFVRNSIVLAQRAEKSGNHLGAMAYLGNAIHTLQDASSPVHRGFQPWSEAWGSLSPQVRGHIAGEFYDPGAGSELDKATQAAWDDFTGEVPLPDTFFPAPGSLESAGLLHRLYNHGDSVVLQCDICPSPIR